jgi:uncharacterized protein YjiK
MKVIYMNFFLLSILLIACGGKDTSAQSRSDSSYYLQEPERIYKLPEELEEISGLSTLSSTQLVANEDETGTLYMYNIEDGRLEKTLKWGEKGDYEGVAVANGTAYVLESKGSIYEIRNFMSTEPAVQEFENDNLEDCDAEGLFLMPGSRNLLIACKEGKEKGSRNIYTFDLEQDQPAPEIYRQLAFEVLEEKLLDADFDKLSLKLRKLLDPKGESGILFPSGIAIHPVTKELYVLSAKTKLLAVYAAEGNLKEIHELRHELFLQPESIAFTANGDMYIGNEGKGGKPNILKFTYVEKQ